MSSDSGLLLRVAYSDECVFHVSGVANTYNTRFWGTEKTREIQKNEFHSRKTVWCAVYANGMVSPYEFNIEIVRGVDFNQILNTKARAKAPEFPQNGFVHHAGAQTNLRLAVRSILHEMFPNSWTAR